MHFEKRIGEPSAAESLREALRAAEKRAEDAEADVKRLRQQNHDAAAKRDTETAPLLKELERFRTYTRIAREMHEAEMARKGKPLWSEISGYGEDTAAEILMQRDTAQQALAASQALVRELQQQIADLKG